MMKKKSILLLLIFTVYFSIFSDAVSAGIGVGVGAGKIEIDQKLKSGVIYNLPPVPVINTGDVAGEYEMEVKKLQDQKELAPEAEWFTFEPQKFYLEPGGTQVVQMTLIVPLKTEPGDYFTFLRARALQESNTAGGASVGVAAAAKLYFTLDSSNIFEAMYYRAASLMKTNAPWSYVILGLLIVSILVNFIRKRVSFNIGIKKKESSKESTD